jgi:hypothetical protein
MSPDYEFKKIHDEYYPMIFQYLTRIGEKGSPIKGLVKRKNTPSFKKIYFLIDS